ncbi:MAG: hypothetical protein II350_01905, partial [Clostridia bacterium]|nr:hypothetical protein [Clostridia bacterium]
NKAVIEALEYSVATMEFNIMPSARPSPSSANDTDKLIAAEYRKLDRIKAAYENGIDTLDEYIENKTKIQSVIKKLEAERPEPRKAFNKKSYSKKVSSVLKIIKDPNVSENEKNVALRSIVDHIVFHRPDPSIDVYFYV